MMMKVTLLNVPMPNDVLDGRRSRCYPPLSLSVLGRLALECPSVDSIHIVDGDVEDWRDSPDLSSADVIGLSATTVSYPCAVEIAERVKRETPDCLVVLGGAHASVLAELIAARRSHLFDVVVRGSATRVLGRLIEDHGSGQLIALGSFRSRVVNGGMEDVSLLFPYDFAVLDLRYYAQMFTLSYPSMNVSLALPIVSSVGCEWRARTGGCAFCCIQNLECSRLSVEDFWRMIHTLQVKYDADFFWDVSDSFASDRAWLADLARRRPASMNARFHVFCRSADIDCESAGSLRSAGVVSVFLGVESFDNALLAAVGKGLTAEQSVRAVESLLAEGIEVTTSVLLGLPGETCESISKTIEAYGKLASLGVSYTLANIMLPLPGSRLFDQMLEVPEFRSKYGWTDLLDLMAMQEDYLDRFTSCGCDAIFRAHEEIERMGMPGGSFYINRRSCGFRPTAYSEFCSERLSAIPKRR